MSDSYTTALIGLGSMGYGMAQSCLAAGLQTYGYDVVPEQMARFQAEGGAQDELHDVAPDLKAAVIVVLNAAQTEEVLFGANALVPALSPGAVVLACATVPPAFARDMETRCAEHGVLYLDAPISGGAIKASQGKLSVMASGTIRPLLPRARCWMPYPRPCSSWARVPVLGRR
jgi:3-hydroxyisobutyrate dehydrogenase-like beta-hydroxyacid dehydrogenase